MTQPGLRLRHLAMTGAARKPAVIEFGPGLNVIYGASDTGKSFVVEVIDFMLGGKPPLRDITERIGYDRILLGIETLDGNQFTVMRSADGGGFKVFAGLHQASPSDDVEAQELSDQHSDKSDENLSAFLLKKIGLSGKRVRKNKRGDTISLSFRNLARLLIVTETEITQQRSPLQDGNPTADTPNFATFKLLLTGVDDSSLIASNPKGPEEQTREAQLGLLDKLLDDHRDRLGELTKNPNELEDQLDKLQNSISTQAQQLHSTEAEYRTLTDKRKALRKAVEEGQDRRSEIGSLLERFNLLDRHYASDISRLKGIEEGGTLFEVLGKKPCPLCGAESAHQKGDSECEGNISAVVAAARSEIAKIELLRTELAQTVAGLNKEAVAYDKRLPKLEGDLKNVSAEIENLVAPRLGKLRAVYSEFADKRGQVREALSILITIQDIERRRVELESESSGSKESSVAEGDLPASVADKFAQHVQSILKDWHFPDSERVFFDPKSRDLIIGPKARIARGKGLRAITHAAFTIGLLEYCKTSNTAHPGFVILDSPLLAYRAPEGKEDDLTGTDLNERFYNHLSSLQDDRQIIILENSDPPSAIQSRLQVTMFSKNPHSGRYGFFPLQTAEMQPPVVSGE